MRRCFFLLAGSLALSLGFGVTLLPVAVAPSVATAVTAVSSQQRATGAAPFRMIGVRTAAGGEGVTLRVHRSAGWGPWQAVDPPDGPDATTAERRRAGVALVSEPVWVGRADGWEVHAPVGSHASVVLVREQHHRVRLIPTGLAAAHAATAPDIHPRNEWNARAPKVNPSYASGLKVAFIHHTVDSNDYAAADVPAMLRAIQAYHMDANGWDDIAYNFLVDRFGTVWEGRAGGVDRPVIGAHTGGFNTGSTGVAVIGEFTTNAPPAVTQSSVATLLAWKLALSSIDPKGTTVMTSAGSDRYPSGQTVLLPNIAGHRDTWNTACPGQAFYERLPDVRAQTAARTGAALAYPGFDGGVFVAAAQLDGDAASEFVTGADAGGGPHVRTFEANGTPRAGLFAFGPNVHGGVRVAAGNVDALGPDEIIAAPGRGEAPLVKVLREDGTELLSLMAYAPTFTGGVYVAAGNVDALPGDEVVTGAGAGGGPHVRAFDAAGTAVAGFFAYDPQFPGGVRVAVGDVDGDGLADIVTGAGPGGGPHVRAFHLDGTPIGGFFAYDPRFTGGVYVATLSQGAGKPALIVTGAGEGGGPHVRVFGLDGVERSALMANFSTTGVRVASGLMRGQAPGDIVMSSGAGSLSVVKLARFDGSPLSIL